MEFVKKLDEDMIAAMKNKEKERLIVIREVKAAMKLAQIDGKKEINDELLIDVVSKAVKSRKESIKEFEKGNRQDLIDKPSFEIEVLNEYLPTPLTNAEIEEIVARVIQEVNPTSISDMGKVMGRVTPLVKGRADMSEISKMIREKLQ